MDAVHATVGSLVIVAFAANLILYLLQLTSRPMPWARYVSYAAAGVLLLQLLLGVSLLFEGYVNVTTHYVVALLTIVPVGYEHAMAGGRRPPRARLTAGAIASLATLVLAVVAYLIGQGTIG